MDTIQNLKTGSLFGAILLVAGCCIGAGMLGLPVISALSGFKPSLVMFIISWLFMMTTAMLLLEVNLGFEDEVSIISMADRTLGIFGRVVSWSCFVFLFYALGVAYISGSGELISGFCSQNFQITFPGWIGSLFVSLLFGFFVYLGTQAVDIFNRFLMGALILSYMSLIVFGYSHVNSENFSYYDWGFAKLVLPVMLISFGFHNLVPSLTTYLQRDAKRLRLAVFVGSALPLIIYVIWEWLILGLMPLSQKADFLHTVDQASMATDLLKNTVGVKWIIDIAEFFALFAILTSFLGNSLSFVDFLADGFQIKKDRLGKLFLCLMVIIPPFILSLIYPRIFLSALNYAGAFGAVILFGILPALMAWSGRYCRKFNQYHEIVPGGKWVLTIIMAFAFWVILVQFKSLL